MSRKCDSGFTKHTHLRTRAYATTIWHGDNYRHVPITNHGEGFHKACDVYKEPISSVY